MDKEIIIKMYNNGDSINQISKTLNTYPTKIYRILKGMGISTRNKSEAQKLALENGISIHPTLGKNRDEATKNKISESNHKNWAQKDEVEKEKIKQRAKENWEKKTADERIEMHKLAGHALRQASIDGSKAEKFIKEKLIEAGHNVHVHRKDIGGKYEVDLYIPEHRIAIEIDGPQHFLPIFGEDKLAKSIKFDTVKNGLLISKGIRIIRVKYIKKHSSKKALNDLWNSIEKSVNLVIAGLNKTNLIEIEA